MDSDINLVWIGQDINSKDNIKYRKDLESQCNIKMKCFFNVYESVAYLKTIKYEETFIIVSGK